MLINCLNNNLSSEIINTPISYNSYDQMSNVVSNSFKSSHLPIFPASNTFTLRLKCSLAVWLYPLTGVYAHVVADRCTLMYAEALYDLISPWLAIYSHCTGKRSCSIRRSTVTLSERNEERLKVSVMLRTEATPPNQPGPLFGAITRQHWPRQVQEMINKLMSWINIIISVPEKPERKERKGN